WVGRGEGPDPGGEPSLDQRLACLAQDGARPGEIAGFGDDHREDDLARGARGQRLGECEQGVEAALAPWRDEDRTLRRPCLLGRCERRILAEDRLFELL